MRLVRLLLRRRTYARLLAVLSGGGGSRLLLSLSLLVGLLLIGRSAHFSEYILGAGVVGTATEGQRQPA
jgi:hypothetical protein